jgi:hypothetical protein
MAVQTAKGLAYCPKAVPRFIFAAKIRKIAAQKT